MSSSVIAMVLITAVIVFALDLIFESANKYGLEKIKDVVSSNATNTVNNAVVENATVDNTEPQPEVTTDNPDTTADQSSDEQAEAPVEE